MRTSLVLICSILVAASANALAPAGAYPVEKAAGGANQRASVEGCVNQWLFDGVWRVRVTNVADNGAAVTLQVRNGTSDTLSVSDAGFAKINGQGITLALSDGSVQDLDLNATSESYRHDLSYKKLPPGAAATTILRFAPPSDPNLKPSKLLIAVDPHFNSAVHYTVGDPSFRVHLDCTK